MRNIATLKRRHVVLLAVAVVAASWTSAESADPKPVRVAMILWRGETEAEKGFRAGLKELNRPVDYVVLNAGQDRAELGRLLREELQPRLATFDYVYAYGTTVTLAAKSIVQDKVPLIFNIVNDPVGAGIVASLERSGANVAGVTNEVSLQLQLKTALAVFPIKRLGLMFNPREKNSMLARDRVLAVAQPLGIEVVDLRSPPAQDMLQENLKKLRSGAIAVDAVYIPADSFLVSNGKLIAAELTAARVKSIAAVEGSIDQGALIGVVAQYQELGLAAAGMVRRHLAGQALKDMPVEADREPAIKVNRATSRALGVEIPDAIRKRTVFVE